MNTICRNLLLLVSLGCLTAPANSLPLTAEPPKPAFEGFNSGKTPAGPFSLTPETLGDPTGQIPPEVVAKLLGRSAENTGSALAAELRRRLEEKPGDPNLMHSLATVLFHQGGEQEAQALWAGANKWEPNLAPADLMTAIHGVYALLASGATKDAQQKLRQLEKKFEQSAHFHLMRGEQALRGRNQKAAETAYRRAVELAPKLYVTQLNYARFLDVVQGDAKAASARYETAARLAPKRPETWRHFGNFLARQGRYEAALAALGKFTELDANAGLPERQIAEIVASEGKYEDARKWFVAAKSRSPSEAELQAIRIALGDTLLRLRRLNEARAEIQASLDVQEVPPLVFALATIDDAEGKNEAAERGYRRTLALMPTNALAANNLAMLLIKANKAAAEALSLSEKARAAIPNNAIIDGTWGCALAANQRPQEAARILTAVVQQTPNDAWTHYCLGKALAAQKDGKQAQHHLRQAMKLDPAFLRQKEVSALLEQMR